jgi:hypothetical protein
MTESVATSPQPLADILDSKPELREILARNPNLAHACLLLRRGEAEDVEKALDLAIREADQEAQTIAECIRIELARFSERTSEALERAEVLARSDRFHPAAALCLRNLFPLMPSVHLAQGAHAEPLEIPAGPDTLGDDGSVDSLQDSQAVHAPEVAAPAVHGFSASWNPIVSDPSVLFLRLRTSEGLSEQKRIELAAGAAEEAALARSHDLLVRLGLGELRHAAFEGGSRTVHAWRDAERSALAVMSTGASTSLLAARCTKCFQEDKP